MPFQHYLNMKCCKIPKSQYQKVIVSLIFSKVCLDFSISYIEIVITSIVPLIFPM